jgi:hypothetical protein
MFVWDWLNSIVDRKILPIVEQEIRFRISTNANAHLDGRVLFLIEAIFYKGDVPLHNTYFDNYTIKF